VLWMLRCINSASNSVLEEKQSLQFVGEMISFGCIENTVRKKKSLDAASVFLLKEVMRNEFSIAYKMHNVFAIVLHARKKRNIAVYAKSGGILAFSEFRE